MIQNTKFINNYKSTLQNKLSPPKSKSISFGEIIIDGGPPSPDPRKFLYVTPHKFKKNVKHSEFSRQEIADEIVCIISSGNTVFGCIEKMKKLDLLYKLSKKDNLEDKTNLLKTIYKFVSRIGNEDAIKKYSEELEKYGIDPNFEIKDELTKKIKVYEEEYEFALDIKDEKLEDICLANLKELRSKLDSI